MNVIFLALVFVFFEISDFSSHLEASPTYSLRDCYGMPLDQKLIEKMGLKNGFYVEVGANDGITQSNTKLLEEEYGWTGILVEPSENTFQSLLKNRPGSKCFQCALGSFEEDNTFIYGDFDGGLMASVLGKRRNNPHLQKVLVRSLQSILDEVGVSHVNFFSLDTEGYELNIIKGIDFSKTTFDYLLVEVYPDEYVELVSLLSDKGYELIENFSNYNPINTPLWDGTHNDYLFVRRTEINTVKR